MKHLLFKIFKIIGEILLILLVLLAILLGATRSFFSYIDSYKPYFEKWASEALHQSVKIGKVEAEWKTLYPIISMDKVDIFTSNSTMPLLHVPRLQVGIDFINSLLQHRLVPSSLTLIRAHMRVHRLDANTLEINGLPLPIAGTASQLDVGDIIGWLLKQGQIRLEEVDLDWQNQADPLFQITHLTAILSNNFSSHQLIGTATLLEGTPPRFRFVINIYPKGFSAERIRADFFVFIKNLDLTPWIKNNFLQGVQMKQGTLNRLQLWAVWEDNQWQQFQALFHLGKAVFNTSYFNKPIYLDQLAANAVWQRQANGFSFAADQIQLTLNEQNWPLTQLSLQQSQMSDASLIQVLQADRLDLNQLQALVGNITSIPDALKTTMNKISPEGEFSQVLLRRELPKVGEPSLSLRTDFSGIKTSAWKKIPGVDGLQGSIRFTPDAGDLQLSGNYLRISALDWFNHPFVLAQYQGRIQWINQDDGLKLQATDIALADSNLGIRAQLDLWSSKQATPYVQLLASFSEQDASRLKDYVPVNLLHTHGALSQWLTDAFRGGESAEGQLLLQGPLADFPFDNHAGQFQATVHVKNMLLDYKKNWPAISHLNADLLFNNRSLDVQSSQANILNVPVNNLKAKILDLANAKLDVGGEIKTDMQNGLNFIAQSPLKNTVGEGLRNLALNGAMQLDLNLHIPLHQGKETSTVQGNVLILPDGRLTLPTWDVHLTDLAGAFAFTENSLSATQLTAKWLDQPINIVIQTQPTAKDKHTIMAKITGHTTIAKIQKEYDLDSLKNKVSGETDYTAALKINQNKGHSQMVFSVDTDLQGIAIDSPEILKKSTSEKRAVYAEVSVPNPENLNLYVQYAKKISAAMSFAENKKNKWDLWGADIRLGGKPAEFQTTPGLVIDGYLPQLAWADISEYVSPLFSKSSAQSALPLRVQKINLDIGQFTAFGITLSSANIWAEPKSNSWLVGIKSPIIFGNLNIPTDLSQLVVGNFDRFQIMPNDSQTKTTINPEDLPPLDLGFKNFIYGNKPFGAVSLLTMPGRNSLEIKRLALDIANTHLLATGRWQLAQGRQQTTLSGNLKSDNIGTALKNWQVTASLQGGAGTAAFALTWPSAAYDFSTKQLNGSFSLSFGKGSIINIGDSKEAEMGIGRILNLLSLQNLPRRLSLDFTDLLGKGFPFDAMKGDFSIQNGNAVTNNASLHGPIAKVSIKGRIGFGNKDYDLIMMTTPYITSSLPVAATIVGGPIVGAVTWLGNKVLGRVVNKIAESAYSVKGSWDNPVVEPLVSGSADR